MIEINAEISLPVEDAGVEMGHMIADLLQEPGEQAVQLVAKSAPFLNDDLIP